MDSLTQGNTAHIQSGYPLTKNHGKKSQLCIIVYKKKDQISTKAKLYIISKYISYNNVSQWPLLLGSQQLEVVAPNDPCPSLILAQPGTYIDDESQVLCEVGQVIYLKITGSILCQSFKADFFQII